MLPDKNPNIIKIELKKFDQESIDKAVREYIAYPVKIFVNCKTGKYNNKEKKAMEKEEREKMRKAIMQSSMVSNT